MSQLADIERSKRQAFAAPGGSFDRLIGILRVALPAGVGALAAVLVISPVTDRNEFSFLLDRNTVDLAPERLKITDALYRGQDKDGQPFTVRGESAIQRSSKVPEVELTGLLASFSVNGQRSEVSAQNGRLNLNTNIISIDGPMQFISDSGYSLSANDVAIDVKEKTLRSTGGVNGSNAKGALAGERFSGNWATQQFGLSGAVAGRAPFGSFSGSDLRADLAKEQVRLTGGVAGTTRFGTYRADTLEADQKAGTVVLQGNARLRIDGGALQ